jgi:tetratricopeptide (TPR) repeat protein
LRVLISYLTVLTFAQFAWAGTTHSDFDRAWEFYRNGDYLQVRSIATAGLKTGNQKAAWTELLAFGWTDSNPTALQYAAQADQLSPGNPHIMSTYAYFMSYEPQLVKGAMILARKAELLAPKSGRAHAVAGWCFWRVGGMNEAANEFEQAINLAPADFDVNYFASKFYQLGALDQKAGLACWNRLASAYPKSPFVWFNKAEFRRRAEDPAGSIQDYDKAIELKPDFLMAYCSRGRNSQFMRHFEEAIKDYTFVIRMLKYSAVYAQRAECYEQLRQYDKAISDYAEAIKLTNAPGEGNQVYNPKSLSRDDQYRHFWLKKITDYVKSEQYASAVADATKILKAEPKCGPALDLRQNALRKAGRYEEALTDLTTLIKVDPMPDWYKARASVYAKLNRAADSKADSARAQRLDGL